MAIGVDVGTGTTVTFADLVFQVLTVDLEDYSIAEVEKTHMGSTTHEYVAGDLPEPGFITLELQFDEEHVVPLLGVTQAVVIAFTGVVTPHLWGANGFLQSFDAHAGLEELMTATARIKFTDALVKT